jgi:predicted ferric reductase
MPQPKPTRACAGSTVYLCAPTISRLEWHAMTIASTSQGGKRACLVIKACGGWSDALYALADAADAPGGAAELPLLIEGPYPSRAAARAVRAAAGGASVVLVGGGSGVTPFTAVLEEALAAAGAAGESHDGAAAKQQGGLMHRLRLVWVLRSLEVRVGGVGVWV